ncbi:MAG: site-specific DNA-methyltransferase [Parcubacteria group bacterium]|nr:site-specific DNA-methyltransferase [Parcubacteria group bacterium]
MGYKIFNKSSESMTDIDNESIDLIFFSPPYNIKTFYGNFNDNLKFEKYLDFMKNVILECARKLKKDGRLIIEIADSIFINQKYIQLAGVIQKLAVSNADLFLETRHINFIQTKDLFELPDHGFDKNYSTSIKAHSNCHQILVFNKTKTKPKNGEILYINHKPSSEHPCPEPQEMIDFIFKNYFKTGMKVLDPFMGTANLGIQIVRNGGTFLGYELVERFYNIAKKKLESA